MSLNEFTEATAQYGKEYSLRPRIVCNDGFSMSVQGNSGSYSSPREVSATYEKMEIGFPSEPEPLIAEFAEDADRPTDTVYGYVPTDIIQQVIDKHGGISIAQTDVKQKTRKRFRS